MGSPTTTVRTRRSTRGRCPDRAHTAVGCGRARSLRPSAWPSWSGTSHHACALARCGRKPGVTYVLAALLLVRGLEAEAWETALGAVRATYERGFWFRTPEAWDVNGNYRASLYMRPLAIWAIEHAIRLKTIRSRSERALR